MNVEKIYSKIFFMIAASLVMVSYQNCAEPFQAAQFNNVHKLAFFNVVDL